MNQQTNIFEAEPPITSTVLTPEQSLALRNLIEAMKKDDSIFSMLPESVRTAVSEIYMPTYSSAEALIRSLVEAHEHSLRLLEKFAMKIRSLEEQLQRRKTGA